MGGRPNAVAGKEQLSTAPLVQVLISGLTRLRGLARPSMQNMMALVALARPLGLAALPGSPTPARSEAPSC